MVIDSELNLFALSISNLTQEYKLVLQLCSNYTLICIHPPLLSPPVSPLAQRQTVQDFVYLELCLLGSVCVCAWERAYVCGHLHAHTLICRVCQYLG